METQIFNHWITRKFPSALSWQSSRKKYIYILTQCIPTKCKLKCQETVLSFTLYNALCYFLLFFAFFFLFYSLSLTHHPHWFLNSVWKSLLWVSTAEFVSDPLGKTVTAWIWCQSHLILLVTKIVPRPCAHFSPPSATPSPKAYSALVSPWPQSLLTRTDGCLGLHPARALASGATPAPGEGPEPQLQLQTAGQRSPAVKSPGSEARLPRVQIPAVPLATRATLIHLTNCPIREGSWVGK